MEASKSQETTNVRETKEVVNQVQNDMPETLTNTIYTPAFLREQIGKLMRVEFLIGTNNITDRIGILADVGASYILLRSFENDSLVYCDLYSIKFITISTTSNLISSMGQNQNYQMRNNYNMSSGQYWKNKYRYTFYCIATFIIYCVFSLKQLIKL